MGRITSSIGIKGSLGELSAYTMRGVDGVLVRRKGGASKKTIKESPAFAGLRRNNKEFSGRSLGSKWIMRMLAPLKPLADYNIAGPLNAILKPIQAMDTQGEWGKKNIELSQNPKLLEGFSLNNKIGFDRIVRTPVFVEIRREDGYAKVMLPELLPYVNFFPGKHSVYSFQVTIGIIPDLFFKDDKYAPTSSEYEKVQCQSMITDWAPTQKKAEAKTIEINTSFTPPDDHYSLMVTIGIRYGIYRTATYIEQVKYAGGAKVVGMA